jgi:hypothetical protein
MTHTVTEKENIGRDTDLPVWITANISFETSNTPAPETVGPPAVHRS